MRRKLSRGIARFRKLQATYTPGALQALARRDADPEEVPENCPLMLPSALSSAERDVGCIAGVQLMENLARDAQCSEALLRLRNHENQAAWAALRNLNGGAKSGWRKLRREDVRTMEDPEELTKREALRKKQTERRKEKLRRLREEGEFLASDSDDESGQSAGETDDGEAEDPMVSWIWTGAGSTGTDAELEDGLRIEWTKARARARRWQKEVALLEEEYRRVLISFEHEAAGWEERAKNIPVGTVEVGYAQGAVAYALKQARMYRDLASKVTLTMTENTELHMSNRKRFSEFVMLCSKVQVVIQSGDDVGERSGKTRVKHISTIGQNDVLRVNHGERRSKEIQPGGYDSSQCVHFVRLQERLRGSLSNGIPGGSGKCLILWKDPYLTVQLAENYLETNTRALWIVVSSTSRILAEIGVN
ncbi:hypothetical protein R3P38DRAFT_3609029 [Favolaschia claudopus]|uniref:Uncharacterized protein n=1 Tax=Favolaschia claudopus TaxID=2862362 RepID=A0AAW0A7B1_9AGAR